MDAPTYEQRQEMVAALWGKSPEVKSLWQSKIYYETTMRLLTRGSAPHFMHYVKHRYFPVAPADSALSIGSGIGEVDRIAYEAGLFNRCRGLDISPDAIQSAREFTAKLGYPITYQVADLNRISLVGQGEPFSVIYANASLHHVSDLEHLFREVDAVLDPSGLFFFHEYVGPSRFQWRPKTLDIANRVLRVLPLRLRGNLEEVKRMTHNAFLNGDPSEAVHSEEIISIATMFFEPIETIDAGTTLTHPLLNDIVRYFNEDDEGEQVILRLIFLLEEILIQEGVLESDTKLVICRKRPN